MPARKLLILGGIGEAAALARRAVAEFGDRLQVTSSLAGRTKHPAVLAGHHRRGGFGGAAGLTRYLTVEGIDFLIDATHPFAVIISRHAREACDAARVPRLQLLRPRWRKQPGDQWVLVDDAAAAAHALIAQGGRALITIGVKELAPFAALDGIRCLIRVIEVPDPPPAFEIIIGRGPFTVAAEKRLFIDKRIDVLVTKASGAAATRAKITAARSLGLPVVMIRRPPSEPGEQLRGIRAALRWIGDHMPERTAQHVP